jgi:hypothetical protein
VPKVHADPVDVPVGVLEVFGVFGVQHKVITILLAIFRFLVVKRGPRPVPAERRVDDHLHLLERPRAFLELHRLGGDVLPLARVDDAPALGQVPGHVPGCEEPHRHTAVRRQLARIHPAVVPGVRHALVEYVPTRAVRKLHPAASVEALLPAIVTAIGLPLNHICTGIQCCCTPTLPAAGDIRQQGGLVALGVAGLGVGVQRAVVRWLVVDLLDDVDLPVQRPFVIPSGLAHQPPSGPHTLPAWDVLDLHHEQPVVVYLFRHHQDRGHIAVCRGAGLDARRPVTIHAHQVFLHTRLVTGDLTTPVPLGVRRIVERFVRARDKGGSGQVLDKLIHPRGWRWGWGWGWGWGRGRGRRGRGRGRGWRRW